MEIFGVESLVLYPAQISIICSEEDKILISCFPGPLARDIQEMDEVMPPLSREPVLSSREQSKDSTSTNYWLEVEEFSIETKTSLHDPLLPGASWPLLLNRNVNFWSKLNSAQLGLLLHRQALFAEV